MTAFPLFADLLPFSTVAILMVLMTRQVRIFLRPGSGRHRRATRRWHSMRRVAR